MREPTSSKTISALLRWSTAAGLCWAAGPSIAGSDIIFIDAFEPPPNCAAVPTAYGCPAFAVTTPDIVLSPGEDASYCFYFRAPNTTTIGVDRMTATFDGPMIFAAVFATYSTATGLPADQQPPGTVTTTDCGQAGGANGTTSRLIWRAHPGRAAIDMPPDDGTGTPVAIEIGADQPLFVQLPIFNPTDQPLTTRFTLSAFALANGITWTPTATYVTINGNLSLPPASMSQAQNECAVPAGRTFWRFTTHTHKQGIEARVGNSAGTTIVTTTDWQNPEVATFTPPFYTFAGGQKLTYSCSYDNPTNRTITTGDNLQTDEQCQATAHFFPATKGLICFNNIGPF